MTASNPLARIDDAPIDPREVERAVWTRADGAVVTFTGIVRDHDGGREVSRLEYSAHPRAERFLRELCTEVTRDFHRPADPDTSNDGTVTRIAAVHRIGSLEIGDIAVAVAVSGAHRATAFEACQTMIDRLKNEVPIWKRQLFTEGLSEWVGAGQC